MHFVNFLSASIPLKLLLLSKAESVKEIMAVISGQHIIWKSSLRQDRHMHEPFPGELPWLLAVPALCCTGTVSPLCLCEIHSVFGGKHKPEHFVEN